ncbi:Uncharacterised protein [Achromobacter sp. 2789STDY5608628]|nr:Uncharacterised protein [Achromobacter sp. 2789STDY5608628]
MTANSASSVSLDRLNSQGPICTWPRKTKTALTQQISTAARKAPGIEPRPPTTTTTKALAMISRSSPSVAGTRGAASAPPSPARNAPSVKAEVNSQAWLTPSAASMSRFSAAARSSRPQRVRISSSHSRPSTTGPATISSRSYWGKRRPRISTAPDRPGARAANRSSGPQIAKAASPMMSTSAKVASSWNSSGARYSRLSTSSSAAAPIRPVASAASSRPAQ